MLRRAGVYRTDARPHSAAGLDEAGSAVDVTPLSERSGPTGYVTRPEQRTVPRPLTEYAALAALLVVVLEVGYIR